MKINLWITDPKSQKKSVSLTFSTIAFVLTSLWLLGWLVAKPFGLDVPDFDAAAATGFSSPLFALYFGRKWIEGKETKTE